MSIFEFFKRLNFSSSFFKHGFWMHILIFHSKKSILFVRFKNVETFWYFSDLQEIRSRVFLNWSTDQFVMVIFQNFKRLCFSSVPFGCTYSFYDQKIIFFKMFQMRRYFLIPPMLSKSENWCPYHALKYWIKMTPLMTYFPQKF